MAKKNTRIVSRPQGRSGDKSPATRKRATQKKPPAKKRQKRNRKSRRTTPAVVTAEHLLALEAGVLEGKTLREIGCELGINHVTLFHQLRNTIRPAWREKSGRTVESLIARLDRCYRHAWEMLHQPISAAGKGAQFSRPGDVSWLAQAIRCLQEEAKLLGHYKLAQVAVKDDDEGFRIAGMSTEELDQKMMALVLEKVRNTHEEDTTL